MSANFDHLLLSNQELLSIKDNFVQEIKNVSEGKESSVSFLRHSLPATSPIKDGDVFQVMTIGGSVFKTALIKKRGDETIILSEKEDPIPTFATEAVFFQFLEKHLNQGVAYLGLNLAYPLRPTFEKGLLDGILLRGTKEHAIVGLINKEIGKSFADNIQKKQSRIIHVTVANDTICLFLSEITKGAWNTTIAGIIGTGSNYALGMNNEIINLECGHFDQFNQTLSGKIIDKNSMNPGKQLIEKEIAGAYLFKHFNIIAKANNLSCSPLSSTKELSELAEKNEGDESKLAQIILERSASLAACQMAGIVEFISTSCNFVMEGALFWDAWHYQEMLLKYLKRLKVQENIKFSPVRHHSIRGGIKLLAGLS